MFFTRLKIFILAAITLGAFSVFLLHKLDFYIKNQSVSSITSQLSSIEKFAFKPSENIINIIPNVSTHDISVYDILKGQTGYKKHWFYRSDAVSDEQGLGRIEMQDSTERKVNASKANEVLITKIDGINQYEVRVSTPIIASKSCLECHTGLKEGDLAGIANTSFTIDDTIFAIYDSMKMELLVIIGVASLIFMSVMLFSINSFTRLAYNMKTAVQSATDGNFAIRLKNQGIGIFNDATRAANRLLEVLDKSITSIDAKIASIFVYKKSSYSNNPLLRITELIAEITNLFLFKNKIEAAKYNSEVCREIQDVISRYIKYKYLIFSEIVDGNIRSGYRVDSNGESKIVVGDVRSIENRFELANPNVLFDDGKGCVFISTSIEQLNVIDLKIFISENIMLYYSIALNSKKDLIEKENSIVRIYNYIREARPIIRNNILVKNIEESSYTDPLTKAYNRLYLEKYALSVDAKLKQHANFAVLMLDIDHFKKVNDTYGHAIGDAAIRLLTETIRKAIRSNDRLFRYGGEEFVVILEGCDMKGAQMIAEKIRTLFIAAKSSTTTSSNGEIDVIEITFPKSVSIGISAMPDFSRDIWECINQADLALYEAKESGRNRVIKYTPELKEKEAQKNKQSETPQEDTNPIASKDDDSDDDTAFLESLKLNE